MQSLADFQKAHSAKTFKPDASMVERWQGRIVAQGFVKRGTAGAGEYLAQYGKGIGLDKLIKLARTAESYSVPDLARGFWLAAYRLSEGCEPPLDAKALVRDACEATSVFTDDQLEAAALANVARPPAEIRLKEFPSDMQPGRLATMQPVDAKYPREHYIGSRAYCGQPKRDGQRALLFVTPEVVYSQARTLSVSQPPANIAAPLRKAAASLGAFILDGEIWYPDVVGAEHRTGAQAAMANALLLQPEASVEAHYAVFECLYSDKDLRHGAMLVRFAAAARIVASLVEEPGKFYIEYLNPVYSPEDKARLAQDQKANLREGEIWRLFTAPYSPGKNSREHIVRTKYLQERVVTVIGFTPTKAEKDPTRLFAAIRVVDPETGNPLGDVGTGFTHQDQVELVEAAKAGNFKILVASQGLTEGGKLWLPRFLEIV